MSDLLVEAFRHKAWASKALIAACESLSIEALTRPGAGPVGSILATLNHLVLSDAGYVASLDGGRAAWATEDGETEDLRELAARIEESAGRWERLLADGLDGERLVYLDAGASWPIRRAGVAGCGRRSEAASACVQFDPLHLRVEVLHHRRNVVPVERGVRRPQGLRLRRELRHQR